MRAVALLSGGLDSLLAIRLVLEQGVAVEALNFVGPFCTCTPKGRSCSAAESAVRQLGVPLRVIGTGAEFLEIVKHPPHGYGRSMNPCLDCRILMFRKAAEVMRERRARFLVTGEVLGERPMSQRLEAMRLIEREAGVEGLVLRPLSARLLEPSIPEREGWVDRSRLLAIRGRSRRPQLALAREYGLKDFPCPAGGCLLTDRGFAARLRDLMAFKPDFDLHDVQFLKVGRHFRLSEKARAVVGRNETENARLLGLARRDDLLLEAADAPGPLTVVRGTPDDAALRLAAALTARYGKQRNDPLVRIRAFTDPATRPGVGEGTAPSGGPGPHRIFEVAPATDDQAASLRIGAGSACRECAARE